ncbi:hypothetical protein ACIA5G_01860 [Amycolatopsis sp. NPDC051758]|uniref:hypothetical protein n=1 Tax=Amycolatopsis sp. NPDC051758 TaxID=3363935 RepID=UPI0037A3C974
MKKKLNGDVIRKRIIGFMTNQWIGVSVAGFLGLAGMFFTWLSSKQGRDHAERLAQQRSRHERQLAKEAREQERLGGAYVRLLVMAERSGAWAQSVKPMMDTDPPQPVPPLPEIEAQTEVEATVSAFGSHEVRSRLDRWREVVRDIISAVGLIDLERDAAQKGHSGSVDFGQPYMKLRELRPVEREARRALADQVAAELGHRTADARPPTPVRQSDEPSDAEHTVPQPAAPPDKPSDPNSGDNPGSRS